MTEESEVNIFSFFVL